MTHRRQFAAVLATLVMCAGVLFYTYGRGLAARTVPEQLSDKEYWQIVKDFSEPNGYFRSDNLLSNENAFQRVIPALQSTLAADGVYLGVGPEQNFTYIAAIKPRLAFIVDIRRGNMNLQLLYKAFMELSRDRADFLSRLFACPRLPALTEKTPVEELLDAYSLASPSEELYHRYLQEATDHLMKAHEFALTADDLRGMEYVYNAFYKAGPDLNYSFCRRGRNRPGTENARDANHETAAMLPIVGTWGVMLFRARESGQLVRDGLTIVLFLLMFIQAGAVALRPHRLESSYLFPPFVWPGAVVMFTGAAVMFLAQGHMGTSWRIGIDESAALPLVATGLYRVCRHPIFSAILLTLLGFMLLVPNVDVGRDVRRRADRDPTPGRGGRTIPDADAWRRVSPIRTPGGTVHAVGRPASVTGQPNADDCRARRGGGPCRPRSRIR